LVEGQKELLIELNKTFEIFYLGIQANLNSSLIDFTYLIHSHKNLKSVKFN